MMWEFFLYKSIGILIFTNEIINAKKYIHIINEKIKKKNDKNKACKFFIR